MHLTESMKQVMAYCYSHDNAIHYEYSFDKRDGSFAVRFFLSETTYFIFTLMPGTTEGLLREFTLSKNFYRPSPRVSYTNKYFKKYREINPIDGSQLYPARVETSIFLKTLEEISASEIEISFAAIAQKGIVSYSMRRATGDF